MRGVLSRLLSESAVYGLGAAASQIVGIILVPIYARELGAASYGVVAVLNTTISLSSALAGLALAQAFFRTYLKDSASVVERRHVLATTMTLRLLLSALGAGALAALSGPLASGLLGDPEAADLFLLAAAIVFVDTAMVIPLSQLRAERRAILYAGLALIRAGLGSALIIALVVFADLGVRGVLLGSLAAAATTAAVAIGLLAGELRLGWDTAMVRGMLRFAIPLVPAAAASWTLSFVDRFFLQGMEGSRIVGIYAAGYTVGLAVNVFAVQPFTLMWAAAKWDIYRDEASAPRIFARVTTAFAVAGSFVALAAAAAATDVIRLLLTPEFETARYVVPFSAFAAVLYGLYTLAGTGLNVAARTGRIAGIFAAAAALNVVLNIILIPLFGFIGAAIATIAGYAFLTVFTAIMSDRFYPIPWQVPQVGITVVFGFVLGVAAVAGPDHLAWRAGCLVIFLPVLYALRVVRRGDLAALLAPRQRRERVTQ